MRIGIDLMGGGYPPLTLFQSIEQALASFPSTRFLVFVTQEVYQQIQQQFSFLFSRYSGQIEFEIVKDVINMDDEPFAAVRHKKNSSLILALKLLKKNHLQGVVSLCNTGAFILGVSLFCSLLPGIKRPALLANLPTANGTLVVVDVGGNVSFKAHHLVQFAELGIAYQRCNRQIAHPRVGLLNIGIESKKGTSEVRQAYELLDALGKKKKIVFIGNIEGKEVFQGTVDVLVTDGFTGNVLLKTSEGVASFILHELRKTLEKIPAYASFQVWDPFIHQFDSEEYNGAVVCGVDRVVIKCHGHSTPRGLFQGIKKAIELIDQHFIEKIKSQLLIRTLM